MSQTVRGRARRATNSSIDAAPVAPSLARAPTASRDTSYTTHACPPRRNRRTMFPPMRPRPIMPTCILPPLVTVLRAPRACGAQSSDLSGFPRMPRLLVHGDRALPDARGPSTAIPVAPKTQVDARLADRKSVKRDLGQPARQLRVDVEPAPRRVAAETEDRLQKMEHAAGGPRLRHVRLLVEHRKRPGAPLHTRVQLRQAVVHEGARRLRDVARHAGGLGGEAVSLEAESDDAVVVRPDRPALIRERVVGRVACRERPDAPSAPEVGLEEALYHARGALGARDAAPQAVADVGGDRPHGLLLGVERERIEPEVLAPEPGFEGGAQSTGLAAQRDRPLGLAERVEHLGHPEPRVEDVALELAQRLRRRHLAAVGVDDRVARIPPAHVLVALRRARPVLLEAVPVEVSRLVDPLEAAERRLAVLAEQRVVAEPAPRLVERNQVERRGVGGAVVRRVRDQVEMGELAGTDLVRD